MSPSPPGAGLVWRWEGQRWLSSRETGRRTRFTHARQDLLVSELGRIQWDTQREARDLATGDLKVITLLTSALCVNSNRCWGCSLSTLKGGGDIWGLNYRMTGMCLRIIWSWGCTEMVDA